MGSSPYCMNPAHSVECECFMVRCIDVNRDALGSVDETVDAMLAKDIERTDDATPGAIASLCRLAAASILVSSQQSVNLERIASSLERAFPETSAGPTVATLIADPRFWERRTHGVRYTSRDGVDVLVYVEVNRFGFALPGLRAIPHPDSRRAGRDALSWYSYDVVQPGELVELAPLRDRLPKPKRARRS